MSTTVPGQVTSLKRDITISRQSIYEQDTTLNHTVGTRMRLGDRVFRYCANSTSAALAVGFMTSGPTTTSAHMNCQCAATVKGAMSISITLGAGAATANQYAGGFIWINAGVGIGSIYKIKSHLANAGSLTLVVNLYDPVNIALDATSYATLYANPFGAVVIHPTTCTNRPTGVPLCVVTQSTSAITYYFWAQTGGFAAIQVGATYTIGAGVGVDDTPGQVLTSTAEQWGQVIQIGSAAEKPSLIWLTLDQ